jgi:hypothetical protein
MEINYEMKIDNQVNTVNPCGRRKKIKEERKDRRSRFQVFMKVRN